MSSLCSRLSWGTERMATSGLAGFVMKMMKVVIRDPFITLHDGRFYQKPLS